MIDDSGPEPAPDAARLHAKALQLRAGLHAATRDAALQRTIREWRARSSAHERAWQQACHHWTLAGKLPTPPALPLLQRLWHNADLAHERLHHTLRRHPLRAALPALCLLLLFLWLPWQAQPPATGTTSPATAEAGHPAARPQLFSSAARQRHSLSLPDGSQVTLNWNSALQVDYSATRREVWLLRGEALFDVVPDTSRPFVVRSDGLSAQALGTTFSVQQRGTAGIRVLVAEGRVAVSGDSGATVQLQPGEQVDAGTTVIGPILQVDSDSQLAWIDGLLVFSQRPLAEVLDELGRYTSFRVNTGRLDDPATAVTGTWFIERSDAALALVASAFGLQLLQQPDGSVLVQSLPPQRPR